MAKKKNKKKAGQKISSEPVEIGPGIFAKNYGRYDLIQSHRTPEEQTQLINALTEFTKNFPKEMTQKVKSVEALIARHNSFDFLANLMLVELSLNPETYKEPTHKHQDALVEYAALLCLKRPFSSADTPFVGNFYQEVMEGLEEIVEKTVQYYLLENIGSTTPPTRLDELHRETIVSELMIRSPGYPHHLAELLILLFEPFGKWLFETVGFTIKDLLAIENAVHKLTNAKFFEGRKGIRELESQLRAEFADFLKTGTTPVENHRALFEKLRELPAGKAKEAIFNLHAITFFSNLGATLTFSAQQLSQTSGIAIDRVVSILKVFSLQFGSVSQDFLWPKPNHPLKLQPFIQHKDQFLCPNPALIIWAIRPTLERLLNPATRNGQKVSKDIWEKYSAKRAEALEGESLRLLSTAFKRAEIHQNLQFEFEDEGKKQSGELDGLVIYDKTMILVEAKAGNFPLKARGGFREAIAENLKKLVADAHEQALKAKRFIETNKIATFRLANGQQLNVDKKQFSQIVLMTVTLESLDVFCTNLHQTTDATLFPSGETPWVLPLLDLRVIAEATEFPSQLIHYFRRRLRINRIKKLEAHDELDWFGCYLSDGLIFDPYEHAGPDSLRLGSFTSEFDDYYFHERGLRKTPTEMPRQKMPDLFRKVVLEVDASKINGHSEAVCMLLDFDDAGKNQFAETLARQLAEANNSGRINNFSAKLPNAGFGATCFVCPPHRVQEASFEFSSFVELMKYDAKADRWLGILCISGQSQIVGSWFFLNSPWREDAALAAELAKLNRKSSSQWQKVSSRKFD